MRTSCGWMVGLLVLAGQGVARGQAPVPDHPVTPEAGPWMICVASYTGEQAGSLAHDLVAYLRQKQHLPAWTLNRGAELRAEQGAEVRRRHEQAPGRPVKTVRIEDQFAVLIGGYKDMDAAHAALGAIKALPAPPDSLCYTGMIVPGPAEQDAAAKQAVNPFRSAFVVHNPTIASKPAAKQDETAADLRKFNRDEPWSVIDRCKKPYTLVVAAFQGAATMKPKSDGGVLGALTGQPSGQRAASELNAHNLAEVMRKERGLEAYVLHTRYYSLVTVGGFSSPDDPQIKSTQEQVYKSVLFSGGAVKLLEQPVPMQVPR